MDATPSSSSPQTLGKRKKRDMEEEGAPVRRGSTLFVSNLPYTASSTDLQTLFSDFGPVRTAFVVLEHGSGASKGVGYVSFSLADDAKTAIEQAASGDIILDGRKLRAEWAESKPKDRTTASTQTKIRPPPRPKPSHDPQSIRTAVISGLPSSIDTKTLWKKVRKFNGTDSLQWPTKTEDGKEDPSIAHVIFKTPSAAAEAVSKLHAHVFKGSLLSVTLKRRLDALVKPHTASATDKAPSRASRLIVRNLPWDTTEQDLRALFLPYGPIYSIHIPDAVPAAASDGAPHAKRGFAFVWMLSKSDAEHAIAGCNGKTVRAGMADSLMAEKQQRKKQRRIEKKNRMELGEGASDGEELPTGKGRTIAVDWALGKERWKQEIAKLQDVGEERDSEEEKDRDSSDSGSGIVQSNEESEPGDGGLGVHDENVHDNEGESGSEADDDDDDDGSGHEPPIKPQLPPPEEGTTLFVRNVPFTTTDDELRTLFRAFGSLRYARITMDADTTRSRGTGFVCYWNKADAEKVVELSKLLQIETTGNEAHVKKNQLAHPSILTPDPSSSLAQSLVLHGRTLDVVRAVARDEAVKLKEEGERKREKADKRNIYLLREGVVFATSPAARKLAPLDLERRTSSFNARRALLRSNPSLYVSKTRLSVRQLPLFVTERVLKRLAMHAVRVFEDEVKKGARTGLAQDELVDIADDVREPEDGEGKKKAKSRGKKSFGRATAVKQAKIVRQQERVDVITGKGRSKGYGFVEMQQHADGLRFLRWANHNASLGPLLERWWKEELQDLLAREKAKPEDTRDEARINRISGELERESVVGKSKSTLIVEFSIENVQVVRKRSIQQKSSRESRPEKTGRISTVKSEAIVAPATKKRRVSKDVEDGILENEEPAKEGQRVGSLIGRKRKQRKNRRNG